MALNTNDERNRNGRLTSDTMIPLGAAFAIAVSIFRGVSEYQATNKATEEARRTRDEAIVQKIQAIEARATAIEMKVDRVAGDLWTCSDQERLMLQIRIDNPSFVLPRRQKRCDGEGDQ